MYDRGVPAAATQLETAFVGRAAEMEALVLAVDEVSSSTGRAVFVGGEPGIGKTTLGRRLASHAAGRGLRVLWARCREDEIAPPYWPWRELLRAGMLDLAAEPLIAVLLGPAPADSEAPPGSRTADADRLLVFDRFTGALVDAASTTPLVLVFDDLHGADRSSLSLLQFFIQRIAAAPVLVVGLYRDVDVGRCHPLSHFLAEASREPSVRRMSLRGFDADEVERLVQLASGRAPSRALVDGVLRQTGGNPFFVKELVRLLLADGQLAHDSAPPKLSLIPQTVREVIERRLDGLSAECTRVLGLAAVIGREFRVGVLERVAELPREALLGVLEEAVGARLVAEAPGSGRYSFSHALFRDVLYAELPTTRRVALHRRVGEILESLHDSHPEPHLAELAFHFAEAARGGDTSKAIAYAIRAGRHATASTAFEEAVRCYESALETLELAPERDEHMRCELLLVLSDALWRGGSFQRARATALQGFETARALGLVTLLGRAALGVAGQTAAIGAGLCDQQVVHVLEEALDALGVDETALRALVSARLAQEVNFAVPVERLRALAGDAVDAARSVQDSAVVASVLRNTFWPLWASRTADERLRIAREIVVLAERVGDRATALEGHVFAFLGHIELADRAAALTEVEACARLAESLRQRDLRWLVSVVRGCWASSEGQLDELQRRSQEALELGQEDQNQAALLFSGVQFCFAAWLRGRFEELEQALLLQTGVFPLLVEANRAALAMTYASAGRLIEARSEFERLAAHGFATLRKDVTWPMVVTQLAHTCGLLGNAARAAELYDLLLPHAAHNALAPPMLAIGPTARYLGTLAATMQRWDDAQRHFEAALEMSRRMHTWPQLALTLYEYARMLAVRGDANDRDRVVGFLEEAQATAARLGMADLFARTQSLAAACTGGIEEVGDAQRRETASQPSSTIECIFRREAEFWTVVHGACVGRFKHRKGFEYLKRLLRWPGREFAAFDLVVCEGWNPIDAEPGRATRGAFGDSGVLFDRTARDAYRRRSAELRAQCADAERMNDPLRASRLRAEYELLAEHLAAATGVGGRVRRAGSGAERSRSTVTKGIRAAIRAIQRSDPALGRHLATHVRTGYVCVYVPNPERPIVFRF
jgi:predicted ATPase